MRNDYYLSQNSSKSCPNALTCVSFTDLRIGNESGDEKGVRWRQEPDG